MTFHSSRGRGRRLPASGSFDIGYLALCVAVLPHAIFRPLPGGSPMGADRPMFHASPPGGSLPICEFVCGLPLPILCRPSALSFQGCGAPDELVYGVTGWYLVLAKLNVSNAKQHAKYGCM